MTAVVGKHDLSSEHGNIVLRRERRLQAFHPCYRRFVADLTSCSRELEDLADTFPALLFALVSGYATEAERERCCALVGEGASLREAGETLGLPWWLRRLPAQAFTAPLPAFPPDPDFAFRIANLVPSDERAAHTWLLRIGHALEAAGPEYALWIARQSDLAGPPEEHFAFMAAWAWFSGRPGLLGHRLLRRPWTTEMSLKRAREELAAWRQRLRLIECLGPGIERAWLADGPASGFNFVALRTVDDFIAESEALENCLDQYADQLHTGLTAVFSVRKGTRRVACVEIGLHGEEVTMPAIVQLRAARNRRAPPEVWQAAYSWLGSQRLEPLSPLSHAPKPLKRIAARRQLWNPYLEFLSGTRHEAALRRAVFQVGRPVDQRPRAAQPRTRRPNLGPARVALRATGTPRPPQTAVVAREES
jgi:PcfJ-like protein